MKKIEIIILLIIVLLIPVFVLWGNTFPVFDYYLNKANNHGIMIKKKELNNRTVLLNPYYKNHPFSRVDLELEIKDDFISKISQPLIVSVYENHESLIYPEKGIINNVKELEKYLYYNNESVLPNGSLFSNGESVFFVSRGEYRSILSSDIFKKFGFDWDVVIPQGTGILSILKEGEKIVFNSAHPDGVILKIEESFYLVWEETLVKIKSENVIREAWESYYTVSSSDLIELDSCELKIENNKAACNFNVSMSSFSENQPYIFKFNQGGLESEIIDAHTQLKVSARLMDMKKSFLILMSNLKQELSSKYGGYL